VLFTGFAMIFLARRSYKKSIAAFQKSLLNSG